MALQNSTLTTGGFTFDGSVSSHAFTFGGLSGSANISLNNGNAIALSVGQNNSSTTYSGTLSNNGSLNKIGTGTLTLTGSQSYTGGTTVSAGTLKIDASQGGALPATSGVTLAGGTLSVLGASSGTTAQTLASVNVTNTGSGLSVDGNTGSGTTLSVGSISSIGTGTGLSINTANNGVVSLPSLTVNGGSVTLGSGAKVGVGAVLTVSSGSLTVGTGANLSVPKATLGAGSTVNAQNGSLTISKQLNLPGGVSATLSGGTSFTAKGANLADSTTASSLAVSGGTLTLAAVSRGSQSFTTVGSTSWTAPAGVSSVSFLVVGGGGGGGSSQNWNWGAGGGGAGGVLINSSYSVTPNTAYTVTVGGGGNGGVNWWSMPGDTGGLSAFDTQSAGGGGGGGGYQQSGLPGGTGTVGGSGGGSGRDFGGSNNGTAGAAAGDGVSSFNNPGGVGFNWSWEAAGGGGGAGGAGNNGEGDQWSVSANCSNGGAGIASDITGVTTWYAAGGGGFTSQRIGLGGSGIGGNSGPAEGNGANGAANTGSGGGGSGQNTSGNGNGGKGADGIVVVSWATPLDLYLPKTSVVATSSSTLDLGNAAGNATLGGLSLTGGTTLTLQNSATLTLQGDASRPAIVANGSLGQSASIVSVAGGPSLTIASGDVSVDAGVTLTIQPGISSTSSITKVGDGVLQLAAAASSHTLQTLNSLVISGGTVDLTNHDLFVGGGAAELPGLLGKVTSSGTNPTLTSTTTIALLTGSEYLGLGKTQLDGKDVSGGDLVGVLAYAGDADLDGKIGADDYLALDVGYMFGLTGWSHGDFAQTGTITAADFAIIDNNYLNQSGSVAEGEIALHTQWFGAAYTDVLNGLNVPAAVPEPASLGLLGLGAVGLLRRKRVR